MSAKSGAGLGVLNEAAKYRVVFFEDEALRIQPALRILEAGGVAVVRESLRTAVPWLRSHRADVAVVDAGGPNAKHASEALLRHIASWDWSGAPEVLLLSRNEDSAAFRDLLRDRALVNVVGVGADGSIDALALATTIDKIVRGPTFGLAHWLAPGAEIEEVELAGADAVEQAVEMARSFASARGQNRLLISSLETVTDEMVENARSHGSSGPETPIRFSIGFDGRRIGVGTMDQKGGLPRDVVIDSLARCFDSEAGGAALTGNESLGLYTIYQLVHHLVINVTPGERTECIAILEAHRSFRRASGVAKSLNLFIAGPE